MKTRNEMSLQDSDKAPVTFCDVAACFSEEEWKLLHHWQKELYKNVMKDIHQVLSSLGPLIATSVFSLRPKANGEPCDLDHQDAETRDHILNSDNILMMEEEVESILMDHYGAEGGESSAGSSLGHADIAPVVPLSIKEEGETNSVDHLISERRESITGATRFPFHNNEVEASLWECRGMEREESSICLNSGPESTTPDASIGINEDGETYPIDIQDYRRRERMTCSTITEEVRIPSAVRFTFNEEGEASIMDHEDAKGRDDISSLKGDGSMKRKMNFENSAKCNDTSTQFKSLTGKVKAEVVRSVDERQHSVSQMWSEKDQEPGGKTTTQWQSGFNQPTHSILHQRIPYGQRSDIYNECGSTMKNASILPCETNGLQSGNPYTSFESDVSFTLNNSNIGQQKLHKEKQQHTCIECEKSFASMSKLQKHERTHTGERPYHCTICGKSFNQAGVLNRHHKIHTGERPYQCTVCEKSFNQKGSLIRHQTIHMKERTALESDWS